MKVILQILVAVALAASTACALPTYDLHWPAFEKFVQQHQRKYASTRETASRFSYFKDNVKRIEQFNARGGGATYAVNKFSDLSPDEFKEMYLFNAPAGYRSAVNASATRLPSSRLQSYSSVDWREFNPKVPTTRIISDVKNQGQCGSCWAFSAVEQIESCNALSTGELKILSPQQVVSCEPHLSGCDGGWPEWAYDYVVGAGVESEAAFPYTSGRTGQNGKCTYDKAAVAVDGVTGYKTISGSAATEDAMLDQIAASPMSVCVSADSWMNYDSGVIRAGACGSQIDHCVQVVGYDASSSPPSWIVRNSWGADWGQAGYLRVEAGTNACAIAQHATIVEPCAGAAPPVNQKWKALNPMLSTRKFLAAAGIDSLDPFHPGEGIVVALGGGNWGTSSTEGYSNVTKKWVELPGMITGVDGRAAAQLQENIYVLGGRGSITAVEAFHLGAKSWTAVASLITGRWEAAAAALNGKLYAIGGVGADGGYLSSVEVFDPTSGKGWYQAGSLGTARKRLAAAATTSKIYAIGGCNGDYTYNALNIVEAYDPVADKWSKVASLGTARYSLGAAVLRNKVYAIGGLLSEGQNPVALVEVFEPSPKNNTKWTVGTPMTSGRCDHATVTVGDKIYALGGELQIDGSPTATVEAFGEW